GLGRVQVLGLDPVVVEEPPGAEADDVAGQVADRPEQPAAEPVVPAPLAGRHQTGGDDLLLAETLLPQVRQQRLAAARRVAEPEPLRGLAVEAPLVEEPAGRPRLGRLGELLEVERGRLPVGLDQTGPPLRVAPGPAAVL